MFSRLKPLSANQFTAILSLYYVCVFNIPFFKVIQEGIEKQADVNYLFIATTPLFLFFALSFLFSIFTVKFVAKPFFMLLTLISAGLFFAGYQYETVFDYGMIENIVETNPAESLTYINAMSIASFILTGCIPAFLIYKSNLTFKSFGKELLHKLAYMLVMLVGIGIIAFFYFQNYAAFGRNNDHIKQVIVPTYFIGSVAKYINKNYLQTPLEHKTIGADAVNTSSLNKAKTKPNLVVLIVGETARNMNYQYYGYGKATNQHSQGLGVIAFDKMTSCGTYTALSVPCMFSQMDRKSYEPRRAKSQDNVIDILKRAGIEQAWFDNDSGSKGVSDNIQSMIVDHDSDPDLCDGQSCFDDVLLKELDKALVNPAKKDTMLTLHLMGSHGPTYYLRYPQSHRVFLPDCQRSDIQNCSQEELTNTYDNTILYTDYIMTQVIKKLQAKGSEFNTSMLYLSDHGESLGESGMYLHGAPYAFAPKEQTHVPMLSWMSEDFAAQNHVDLACLKAEAKTKTYSHDNLFSSLLGLLNIKTKAYDPALDIFASCRVK